tara:strand:- start:4295 stop:5251 length:957 start_codon:yes stop_codon:yes gene_type:complete
MKHDEKKLISGINSGSRVSLSRLISLVESDKSAIFRISDSLKRKDNDTYVVGITGPPGAGKSTLTNRLIQNLRKNNKSVAVLAVDPSSPFTGGAVLGDRIRMQEHALDDGVFIRSIGSRGDLGGLSSATSAIIKLFDTFGIDVILIETVGVGQTELDIIKISDCVLVTLVPEAGDGVQAMKAGLMEIGDIFIVNKADRGGAEKLAREVDYMISLKHSENNWSTKVILAEAENDVGTKEIISEIEKFKNFEIQRDLLDKKRVKRKLSEVETLIFQKMKFELENIKDNKKVKNIMLDVETSKIEPEKAVNMIFKLFKESL